LTIKEVAIQYIQAGLCALPAVKKRKMPSFATWKEYQNRLPTEEEWGRWFADALCIVCGAVSGNLRVIDFDQNGKAFEAFKTKCPKELFDRLVVETSQSGGYHVIFRTESEMKVEQKLARDADGKTLIETLGEGKLFLCAPTPGYNLIQGNFQHIPVLKDSEADALFELAWRCNEYQEPSPSPSLKRSAPLPMDGKRPGDALNENGIGFIREILQKHGWKHVGQRGDNDEKWQRPGTNDGHSAYLHITPPVFYPFSTNSHPFESDKTYSYFAVYAYLEHNGDFAAATKELACLGYGDTLTTEPVELNEFITASPNEEEATVEFSTLPHLGKWDEIQVEDFDEIEFHEIDDPGRIPDDLLNPPGLIGEIAKHNVKMNSVKQHELALATGIVMTAHLIGRIYRTPDNLRSNIYIMAVGDSSTGKKQAIDFLMDTRILEINKNVFGPFSSHQSMLLWLREVSSMLICWDELGAKMEAILSTRTSNINQILGYLTELYSAAARAFFPERKVSDKNYNPILEPHCCLYATGTYKSVFKCFTPAMIENGFVGRLNFFIIDKNQKRQKQYTSERIPDNIIEQIKEWGKLRSAIPAQEQFSVFPEPKIVHYNDESKEVFDQFYDNVQSETEKTAEPFVCLWGRCVEEAKKLALIYACSASKENPIIDKNAARWACKLSKHLTLRKLFFAMNHMAASEQGHLENEIANYVKQHKFITQTQLINRFKYGVEKRLRDEAIRNLLATGRLIREKMKVGNSRQTSTIYRIPRTKKLKNQQ
jgi:hypothetical protein